jgi:hypothetical protein
MLPAHCHADDSPRGTNQPDPHEFRRSRSNEGAPKGAVHSVRSRYWRRYLSSSGPTSTVATSSSMSNTRR